MALEWVQNWCHMEIAVSEAKGQLSELVRKANAGEEVLLTRHGRPMARIVPFQHRPNADEKRRVLHAVREATRSRIEAGPDAARSQNFLYGDDGLPR